MAVMRPDALITAVYTTSDRLYIVYDK